MRGYRVRLEAAKRSKGNESQQTGILRETGKLVLEADDSGRCSQRTLKRTPRIVRVIDKRAASGRCLAGCISRSTSDEPIIGAIQPRQWRQHLAVGECTIYLQKMALSE